jgi:DNA-binding transcriptional LysR family regulator
MFVMSTIVIHDQWMELRQLRYVVSVAETGHFTRAAERCHVVQSALSHQIAKLERELGARLFDRTRRQVRLTAAGEAFVPAARQALDAAARARAEVAAVTGEVRGRLALGAIGTVTAVDLAALLADFHTRYPDVRIALRSGASLELIAEVRAGGLDAAFLGVPSGFRPTGVRHRRLAVGELVAVLGPAHPLAGRPVAALRDLAAEAFVDFPAGSAARAQSDEAFAAAGIDRDVAFEVSSVEFLGQLVGTGLGVGLVPADFATQLSGVRVLPLSDAPARVEHLVWGQGPASPATAAFLIVLDSHHREAGPR